MGGCKTKPSMGGVWIFSRTDHNPDFSEAPACTSLVLHLKLNHEQLHCKPDFAWKIKGIFYSMVVKSPSGASADLSGKFLSHCSQISVREHMQINGEPIVREKRLHDEPKVSAKEASF